MVILALTALVIYVLARRREGKRRIVMVVGAVRQWHRGNLSRRHSTRSMSDHAQ